MVNPYGKYVTQGFSPAGLESPLGRKPDSSLRARGPHGPAAALRAELQVTVTVGRPITEGLHSNL
jgi:hypothetical protein